MEGKVEKKNSFEIEFEVTIQYGLIYIRGEGELLQEDVWKWLEVGVNKFYIMELKLICLYFPKVSKHFHLDSLPVFA